MTANRRPGATRAPMRDTRPRPIAISSVPASRLRITRSANLSSGMAMGGVDGMSRCSRVSTTGAMTSTTWTVEPASWRRSLTEKEWTAAFVAE